ncbi:MAG TPA: hypothetical protein VG604_04730 [Candidatus Saccharimonadales bacterium]|nr:hypothetical protein [Candidatus Saccharimonadales bacterium]
MRNWPEAAVERLDSIAKDFELYPCIGYHWDHSIDPARHSDPAPNERAHYLRLHPTYVDGKYQAMAFWLAKDRSHVEALPEEYQEFAGVVIGCVFRQQELLEIASEPNIFAQR